MTVFNVYLIGVGGQGIGLLSEILLRAADHAGQTVKGVDTHGLAQRGGIVVSQLRFGEKAYSPLIADGQADLVIALECTEALRGMHRALRDGGTVVYYNATWQPLPVRLNESGPVTPDVIGTYARKRKIKVVTVSQEGLEDPRMQNMVILGHLNKRGLVPGIRETAYRNAMTDLMAGAMLEKNLALFDAVVGA